MSTYAIMSTTTISSSSTTTTMTKTQVPKHSLPIPNPNPKRTRTSQGNIAVKATHMACTHHDDSPEREDVDATGHGWHWSLEQ